MVKASLSQCRDAGVEGSIPGQGTKIPHAVWCGQKKKEKGKEEDIITTKNNVWNLIPGLFL